MKKANKCMYSLKTQKRASERLKVDVKKSVALAAQALYDARAECRPILPLRDWLAPEALDHAYAVQSLITQRRLSDGATRIGRKIGLTSTAVQKQLGVNQPNFCVLFDIKLRVVSSGHTVGQPLNCMIQPKIEGELAFVFAKDTGQPTKLPA